MSKFGRLIPNKIHLLQVNIVRGFIDNPPGINAGDIVGFEVGMGYFNGFNLDEKLVKTELEIKIASKHKEESPRARGLFRLNFLFSLDNFDELVKLDQSKLKVSNSLGNALASISYSTARGILLTRFQGTILNDLILPVIDPNELLKPENSLARNAEDN